ncbi:c-type cytochrome [Paenibacillus gorillae]|uniref:c-type cytochrome n=1 Tax=Paenibacillus gorillae TaxID=1243662 RepID=UPI0004B77EAB|nr:cytochrome c [Paenibacillus gorillae]
MYSRYVVLLCACLLIVMLSACGSQAAVTNDAVSEQNGMTNGDTAETLYKNQCLSCHGTDLEGSQSGTNLQHIGSTMSEEQIAAIITNGKGGMPAFGRRLSESEIQSLAKWLSEQH